MTYFSGITQINDAVIYHVLGVAIYVTAKYIEHQMFMTDVVSVVIFYVVRDIVSHQTNKFVNIKYGLSTYYSHIYCLQISQV